jgi:tetratricopeptide (TPR) repeat protein
MSDDPTRALAPTGATAAPLPSPPATPICPPQIGRYRIEGEIARGGMGVVVRAVDPDFGRTLAVKVLRERRGGDEAAARRFLDEARLCGQLQHPGIPPVHEMGTLPDGRPFFAMKLVQGETLAALLARRADPADDLPRLLAVFEQVCQTVAYAHARGIIHRDLKPANIMVGEFGEVQVMDWGLAKRMQKAEGRKQQAQDTQPGCSPSTTSCLLPSETHPGAILGTPAYMPPEQARGQTAQLDERADVFALGAILCVILTGRPPYSGVDSAAVLRGAVEGDLAEARARLAGCGADEELVRLALACLAFEPAQRPRDAAAVARAAATYRAGVEQRLRQAELARAQAEVRAREEGKRRRVLLGLAAAVLLLVLTGGAAAWLLQQQHTRRLQADRETGLVLERARGLLTTGRQAADLDRLAEAKAEADRAAEIARSGGASAPVLEQAIAFQIEAREQLQQAREEARQRQAQAERNDALLRDLLDVSSPCEIGTYARTGSEGMAALAEPSVDEQYAAAFRRWGDLDVDKGSAAEVAAQFRQQPQVVVQEILAALDNWMLHRRSRNQPEVRWGRLFQVADALDRNPRSRQLRSLLVGEAPRPETVAGLLGAWPPWPALWELARGEKWRRLLALQEGIDPATEPVLTLLLLAQASEAVGDAAAAEALLRRATAARPEQVVLLDALGRLLARQGRAGEAIECFRAARTLRPQLGVQLGLALVEAGRGAEAETVLSDLLRRQPNNPELHFYHGNTLAAQHKMEAAIAAFRQAIYLKRDSYEAHVNLGSALTEQNEPEEAVAAFQKAITLKPGPYEAYAGLGYALRNQRKPDEAVAAFHKAIDLNPDFAVAYLNLGLALQDLKKPDEAVAAYRKAIALQPDFAKAHYDLGLVLREQNKPNEAIAAFHKAIAIQPDFAWAYSNLGLALGDLKKPDEAIAAFQKAIALRPDYAEVYVNLGNALTGQKKLDEALAAFQKAIVLKPDLAKAHNGLGNALREQKKPGEAVAAFRRAIALQPDFAPAYSNLGLALHELKKLDDAIEAYRKAIALQPDDALAHYNLGVALREQKKLDEAVAAFRRAIELNPADAVAYLNLGHVLLHLKKLDEAVVAYRQAIALRPEDADAHYTLGNILLRQNKLEEAVAILRKVIDLKPDFAKAYSDLGVAQAQQQKLDEAIASFRKAIALQPDDAAAYSNLGTALLNQKKLEEAVAAYRKAIGLKPNFADGYRGLGAALHHQKKWQEAVAAFRKADQLLPNNPLIRDYLRQAEQLLALDRKLAACLTGKDRPGSPRQAAELAAFCGRYRECYHAATRFYADAFRDDPRLPDNLDAAHRHNAACWAALAAAGQGRDAAALAADERAGLRRQALAWLQADLDAWRRHLRDGNPRDRADADGMLSHWQRDPDLSAVRHPWALLRLPADERRPWQKLWTDVAALAKRAPSG